MVFEEKKNTFNLSYFCYTGANWKFYSFSKYIVSIVFAFLERTVIEVWNKNSSKAFKYLNKYLLNS